MVSGGVDVSLFAALAGPERGPRTFDDLVTLARRVDALPCPTVFAAHGLCLTWAFELALACDLILAAESASFGLVERVIGLTPAMGGTQRLAERAGTGRAREFVMTGERYTAAELERWNVVNRVFPDDGFDAAARELAAELATAQRWPTPPPSGSSGTTWRAGWSWPTSGSAGWPESCSPPRTCRGRCAPSWTRPRAGQFQRPLRPRRTGRPVGAPGFSAQT